LKVGADDRRNAGLAEHSGSDRRVAPERRENQR
jgi:hypothetical protein